MANQIKTQEDKIAAHLQKGNSITRLQALRRGWGIELPRAIFHLKNKRKMNIDKQMIDVKTSSGTVKVAKYFMKGEK